MRNRRVIPGLLLTGAALLASGPAGAQISSSPPTAAAPGCHTADASGQPATLFAPGDHLSIKGEGFGQVTSVRVNFVQGSRTLSMTTAEADELGVFSTSPGSSQIPATAGPGPASVHAFSSTRVATCAVQVMATPGGARPQTKKRSWGVVVWAGGLILFGLLLIGVVLRRWRASRLARVVDGFGSNDQAWFASPEQPSDAPQEVGRDFVLEDEPRASAGPTRDSERDPIAAFLEEISAQSGGAPHGMEPAVEVPPPLRPLYEPLPSILEEPRVVQHAPAPVFHSPEPPVEPPPPLEPAARESDDISELTAIEVSGGHRFGAGGQVGLASYGSDWTVRPGDGGRAALDELTVSETLSRLVEDAKRLAGTQP